MPASISTIPDDLLATVAENFDLGAVVRAWPAAHGIENRNYFVVTRTPGPASQDRSLVVTLENQSSFAGDAYASLLERADAAGLPVPCPCRTPEGATALEFEGQPVRVARRLPGQHTVNATNEQLESLGRTLARLHLALADMGDQVNHYPRNQQWLEYQSDRCRGAVGFTTQALIDQTLLEITQLLHRGDVQKLPRGIIHGDLFRDNVLFNEHGLTGILDFHHAATGYWIYDLAVTTNDWCTDTAGRLDPNRTLMLLKAYHRIRPLQREELWFFPAFGCYAALVFLLSRLVATLPASGIDERRKDPGVFHRILDHRRGHFLYFDDGQFQPMTPG